MYKFLVRRYYHSSQEEIKVLTILENVSQFAQGTRNMLL